MPRGGKEKSPAFRPGSQGVQVEKSLVGYWMPGESRSPYFSWSGASASYIRSAAFR